MISCQFENGSPAHLRHVVVHAIVEADGKLLLVLRAKSHSSEGGKWALPGGFVDRNETTQEAIVRELREETGWEADVVKLFRINSRPDRPHEDRQNIALDYLLNPLRLSGCHDDEISEVSWVPIQDLPSPETLAFDHGDSIRQYLRYRKSVFALPLID